MPAVPSPSQPPTKEMGVAPLLGLSGNPGLRGMPPGGVYEQELKPAFVTVTLEQATLVSKGKMGRRQDG